MESLCAILRTGIYPHVRISDLYRALCTRRCDVCCGEFGGFLFLPSATRCCYNCIVASNQLRVISVAALVKGAGISRHKFRDLLPVLRTLPGSYTMEQRTRKSRISLVSYQHALGALRRLGLSTETAASVLSGISETPMGRLMTSIPLPIFDPITTETQRGVCCKGCQIAVEEEVDDWPAELYRRRDQVYSEEGYMSHFPNCPQSMSLWNSSKEGTVSVDEPEFTRRCGLWYHLRK